MTLNKTGFVIVTVGKAKDTAAETYWTSKSFGGGIEWEKPFDFWRVQQQNRNAHEW